MLSRCWESFLVRFRDIDFKFVPKRLLRVSRRAFTMRAWFSRPSVFSLAATYALSFFFVCRVLLHCEIDRE